MSHRDRTKASKGPLIWPLLLAVVGGILLLSNFLLIEDLNILNLWPILLVVIGAQILLRGDLLPGDDVRTFGLTRGSVESATLEINAGEIDVTLRALQSKNAQRLVAGQYASQARPQLDVQDVHAHIRMERSQTPWLSFADWEMGLSRDLPWELVISSHLGQISANLQGLIVQRAMISTGSGDIHLATPAEAFEPLHISTTLGNVILTTIPGTNVRVVIEGGRFFGVRVDEERYEQYDDHVYVSREPDVEAPLVEIVISGTFGDVHLI